MNCLNPYRMKNPKYPDESSIQYLNCACGKCYNCLVNRRLLWYFRLFNESLQHDYCYFVTFTYSDDHCDGNLHAKHLVDYFKRIRKAVDFKYYAIGEFGTHTFRPHYHAVIFSDSLLTSDFLQSKWPYGFISVGTVCPASINYILHYHVRPKEPIKGKRTFQRFSKGLGLSFLFDSTKPKKGCPSVLSLKNQSVANALSKFNNRKVSDGIGHTFIIPRYYVKKLQEQGFSVPEPSYNDSIPFQDLIKQHLPDVLFSADGRCLNYSDDYVLNLFNDILSVYERKLQRYNYQTKNSL